MRVLCLILALTAAFPARAQDPDLERGMDLLGQGLELMLRGFLEELGPELQGLRDDLGAMGGYHPPEILPNGDILIRRRSPDGMPEPDPETGEVEL
ncbi:MAG: hypothetical protein AAF871_09575 [Pseudomonadota bacterium]